MTAVRVVEEMDEAAVVAEVCRSVADMIEIEEAVDEVEIVRSMSSRDMRLLLRARGAGLDVAVSMSSVVDEKPSIASADPAASVCAVVADSGGGGGDDEGENKAGGSGGGWSSSAWLMEERRLLSGDVFVARERDVMAVPMTSETCFEPISSPRRAAISVMTAGLSTVCGLS